MTESYPKPSSIGDDFEITIQEEKMGVMILRRRSYIHDNKLGVSSHLIQQTH